MKKRNTGMILLPLSLMILTGCGSVIPEMTEEEQELVVEYTVDTVLKYNRNYETRLVDLSELEEIEKEKTADVIQEDQEQQSQEAQTEDTDAVQSQEQPAATIESFLGTEELVFSYEGYEIVDAYPERTQEEELVFAMNATDGQKLFVLKLQVENPTETDVQLDVNQSGVRFKICIDGKERNALTTMLLNDLAFYKGTIPAQTTEEMVLICEVPEQMEEQISEVKLIIKNAEHTETILLDETVSE